MTTKVSKTKSRKIRQRAIENLTRKKLKGYGVLRSNRQKSTDFRFLKTFASILLKQTPTTAY